MWHFIWLTAQQFLTHWLNSLSHWSQGLSPRHWKLPDAFICFPLHFENSNSDDISAWGFKKPAFGGRKISWSYSRRQVPCGEWDLAELPWASDGCVSWLSCSVFWKSHLELERNSSSLNIFYARDSWGRLLKPRFFSHSGIKTHKTKQNYKGVRVMTLRICDVARYVLFLNPLVGII